MAAGAASILERIVEQKRRELALLPHRDVTASDVRAARQALGPRRDFAAALMGSRGGQLSIIAEIKKASPSAGVIRPDFDPVAIARAYEAAGANCLSVLTDEVFFQGSLSYLKQVRAAVKLPLLRKDFIIDSRQVLEAANAGADAILLIVAILDDAQLDFLHRLSTEAGLAALVEVHDEQEMERALRCGARLLGVNNRDLRTFKVDLATTERLARRLSGAAGDRSGPDFPLLVAESGIHSPGDVERLGRCGAQAILVGESLMRRPDPGQALRELLGRASPAPA